MEILILNFGMIFCFGLFMFCFKQKHLLVMLIMLEFVVLSLFMLMFINLIFFNSLSFFNMIFLTFSVCEGVLGLSIMIMLVRTHGNDYFQSFNVLW